MDDLYTIALVVLLVFPWSLIAILAITVFTLVKKIVNDKENK